MGFAIAANIERRDWQWSPDRSANHMVVKFHEHSGWSSDRLPNALEQYEAFIRPLFVQDVQNLRQRHQRLKTREVEDLTTYIQIEMSADSLDALAEVLQYDGDVEHLYRAFLRQAPPMDIPPETPDFSNFQLDHQSIQKIQFKE